MIPDTYEEEVGQADTSFQLESSSILCAHRPLYLFANSEHRSYLEPIMVFFQHKLAFKI